MKVAVSVTEMPEQREKRKRAVHRALQNIGFKSDLEIAEYVGCSETQAREAVDELAEDGVIKAGLVANTRRTGLRWYAD